MVMVPAREAPVLACTVYVTDPFPVTLAPEVTEIHEALLTAVHAQLEPVVTLTEPVPPIASRD